MKPAFASHIIREYLGDDIPEEIDEALKVLEHRACKRTTPTLDVDMSKIQAVIDKYGHWIPRVEQERLAKELYINVKTVERYIRHLRGPVGNFWSPAEVRYLTALHEKNGRRHVYKTAETLGRTALATEQKLRKEKLW